MTARPKSRPTISANPEPLVSSTPPVATDAGPEEVKTSTLSLRVPTPLFEHVQREIRRLHYEQGSPKGAVATALLTVALSHMDEVVAHLSTD